MDDPIAIIEHMCSADLAAKTQRLCTALTNRASVAVAWSGGIDSSLVAFFACYLLRDRANAVVFSTPIQPDSQLRDVDEFVRQVNTRFSFHIHKTTVGADEFADIHQFSEAAELRCYFCLRSKFLALRQIADRLAITHIADGAQVSDLAAFNPWLEAADELHVSHPLIEAGISKSDVRTISAALALPTRHKLSAPCLTSRIPFCQRMDPARLARVRHAESVLRELVVSDGSLRCREAETVSDHCLAACPYTHAHPGDLTPVHCATALLSTDASGLPVLHAHRSAILPGPEYFQPAFVALDLSESTPPEDANYPPWAGFEGHWREMLAWASQVEAAALDVCNLRVRVAYPIGRIIARIESSQTVAGLVLTQRARIVEELTALGYERVTLDLLGYKYDGANSPKLLSLLTSSRRHQTVIPKLHL
ncbi:MAG: hypothetical protein NTY19_08315 [Planctomycetota bacterium]|nr:hypothetical protein [Planctomycetota bacterium]